MQETLATMMTSRRSSRAWVAAGILADVARVSISNVVCQTGIAMGAVATAISVGVGLLLAVIGALYPRRRCRILTHG